MENKGTLDRVEGLCRRHKEWLERQANREKKQDAKLKAEGYRWKMTAIVHPKNGGDDYKKAIYFVDHPTAKQINQALIQSEVKDDYNIIEL